MNTEKQPVIIDVRSLEEFAEGHINGALLMPHTQIGVMIGAQVPDKNTRVHLYCRSGGRAGMAKSALEAKGYKHVDNLGGMEAAAKKLNEKVVL